MSARRPLLLPLVPLYAWGLTRKNRGFDEGRAVVRRLDAPVISVGSISAGGAGKTPFLMALAELVRRMGYEPDVLSRGYGRKRGSPGRVDAVARVREDGSADAYGDEPLMLARTLHCPVFVGADRFKAGVIAEQMAANPARTVHLLDDGFGHRKLARTVDIALLTAEDVRDGLLPAGNLREPLLSLRRTDVVVVREGERGVVLPVLDSLFPAAGRPAVWTIRRTLAIPVDAPSQPLAFCGIARPADFEAEVRGKDVALVGCERFRDHHRYTAADAKTLVRQARRRGANGFLTTAKDAVKLDDSFQRVLAEVGPVAVADVRVVLEDEEGCIGDLERMLRDRSGDPMRREGAGRAYDA